MIASELRIGNLIQANGPVMEVKEINEYGVELYLHGSESDNWEEGIENCQGIELSPEILEKCGFVLNGFKEYELTLNNESYSCVNKKLIFAGDYLYLEEWPKDTPAKDRSIVTIWNKDLMKKFYLHKLQNLVFDLSGEELQINL